jgi:hypothetical protein
MLGLNVLPKKIRFKSTKEGERNGYRHYSELQKYHVRFQPAAAYCIIVLLSSSLDLSCEVHIPALACTQGEGIVYPLPFIVVVQSALGRVPFMYQLEKPYTKAEPVMKRSDLVVSRVQCRF